MSESNRLGGGESRVTAGLRRLAVSEFAGQTFALIALVTIGAFLLAAVVVSPLDLRWQASFAVLTVLAMVILNRNPSRGVSLVLVMLSVTLSTRYIWWRITQTLPLPAGQAFHFESIFPAFLGIGLVLAELYAWLALLLGYVQTSWPLDRRPVALPDDLALWPTIDLFITTFNEPLAIVQNTVFGAQSLDYPPDKLRICLLDDGGRQEFREFAEAVGVTYFSREDNLHAKAGNLNNALRLTNGELLALFDADHVPTRAFLQLTVGGFLTDPKLAMVQTPHYFYSPDPFERNLETATRVPNEGQLFYGVVQAGNDLWNAAFFCGSCGVIRRSAIESVGGFATDSVTEDAHSALRMHRAGWNSAYLKLPLAAGLATERLALHVGQRMRWARGMTQIFRIDNPLLGRGLSAGQRICYLNAMLHFFFGLPRVVFLTAPLAYLLFQQNIIDASAAMIVAYAGPHLVHAALTNSRLQTRYRHSFWGEVYECVLALYILRPTFAALIDPSRGRFNVTEKGGLLPVDYFDYKIARPNLVLFGLLFLGLLVGSARFWFAAPGAADPAALALNIGWAIFNLITLGASIAVAHETRQVRSATRLGLVLPASIHLPNGRTLVTQSKNLSVSGGSFAAAPPSDGRIVLPGDRIHIELPDGGRMVLPARIISWQGEVLRVAFDELTLHEHRNLVRLVLCRADAWIGWEDHAPDRPLRGLREILVDIGGLFVRNPGGALAPGLVPAQPVAPPAPAAEPVLQRVSVGLLLGIGLGLAALGTSAPAAAQPARSGTPSSSRGAPASSVIAPTAPAPLTGGAAPPPQGSQVPLGAPAIQQTPSALPPLSQTPPNQPTAPGPAGQTAGSAGVPHGSTRQDVYTLKDLGAYSPIRLIGVQGEGSLPFSVRRDEVVTAGKISLSFAYSPALIPELSHLTVLLNGEVIGSIPLPKDKSSADTAELEINPAFFQEDNRLLFRFIGHYTLRCEDPLHSSLWLVLSNTSSLKLQIEKLPLRNDLSLLPLPFYDPRDMKSLNLPFVFFGQPSLATLQAAGTVASWFGGLAAEKGASFPTSLDTIPNTNAVVFATADRLGSLNVQVDGPTISVITNPNNPEAKLLLVLGRSPEELTAAARTLSLGSIALTGETQIVGTPQIAARKPYDAPRWIPIDRPVHFGELVPPTYLQGNGLVPGLLTLNFRTAPDLFVWLNRGVPLDVRYRYPAGAWMDFRDSRLDVSINNSYLRSLPLAQESAVQQVKDLLLPNFIVNQQLMQIPPYYVFGKNQLQFYYDLRPQKRGECQDVLPSNIQEAIDPDSTIDLSRTERFTSLPNLAFFANSGFPFTRMADLSDTDVVLPDQPASADIEAFLTLMGMMGQSTGFPVVRSTIIAPTQIEQASDKDIIVLGAIPNQSLLGQWAANANLRVDGDRLRVRLTSPIDRIFTALDPAQEANRERIDQLLVSQGDDLAALVGMESPLTAARSVVFITGSRPEKLMTVLDTFRNGELAPLIQGDLMVASGGKVTSFRVGSEYMVGYLPVLTKISWWLGSSPLIFVLFTLIGVLILAMVAYRLLRRLAATRAGPRQVP